MSYKIKLKRPRAKESALFTEFSRSGTYFKFYTGKTIHSKNWSPSKQEVLSGEDNYDLINKYLKTWEKELRRIIEELEVNQVRLTKELIQSQLDKAFKKDSAPEVNTSINDFVAYIDLYIKKNRCQRLNQTRKHVK